jgi:Tfp pilus assembly protein PilF
VERIRRNYSETGFRQAAFQLDQLRAARLSLLPPAQRAAEYLQQGRDYFGQGLLPEAETEFQSALEAEPNSAAAHAGLAEVRVASGDLEQARSEAKLSLQLHPSAAAWLVMARIEMSANQLSECATDVSHALQLEPTNATAISLRQYLAQRGQLLP